VLEEYETLRSLEHKNILRVYGTYTMNEKNGYVAELSRIGTVAQFITAGKPLPVLRGLEWSSSLADALAYVSSKGIRHGEFTSKIDKRCKPFANRAFQHIMSGLYRRQVAI